LHYVGLATRYFSRAKTEMTKVSTNSADYVIVGAGSAGCALAARLSEDGRNRVIVIEQGGSDFGPLIAMPAALSYPLNMARYDWGYRTGPEPHLGGRTLACPRGKVIGGSSSINGMVYVRGHADDFQAWERLGASGWGPRDVAPYFDRLETAHGGEAGSRGTEGPLHVTRGALANPLFNAFIEAGREAGYPVTADYNGTRQEGFGPLERTVWQGRRWSAADAYLKPALSRPNLRLIRGLARRVVFDGARATGVEIDGRSGVEIVTATREVILAASAINSPKLLMLSGIGPADQLKAHGIDVRSHRPGVGANLQDHLEVYIQYECREPLTLNGRLGLFSKAMIGLQWLAMATGDGATNHFEAGAFIRSTPAVAYPDVQLHFLPAAIRYDGYAPTSGHGFQVHAGPMRSPSRGNVTLRSADPHAAPAIRFNYMSADKDWTDFRNVVRLVRRVVGQASLARFKGGEISPGVATQTDAEIDAFVREHAESAYHPCGSCRMGSASDPLAVVDPDTRVIGVEALRVADSSIFPQITYGNLNAPSIMVAEKAAAMIRGQAPLRRHQSETMT
jgi:choline dehydrogenase